MSTSRGLTQGLANSRIGKPQIGEPSHLSQAKRAAVLCQPIPIDEDFGICEHSPPDHLLLVLAAVLVGQVEMRDAHIFALKAWLIKCADEFQDNDFLEIGLKNRFNNDSVDLLARIGKDEGGEVVFWHLGLPWPNCWAA